MNRIYGRIQLTVSWAFYILISNNTKVMIVLINLKKTLQKPEKKNIIRHKKIKKNNMVYSCLIVDVRIKVSDIKG